MVKQSKQFFKSQNYTTKNRPTEYYWDYGILYNTALMFIPAPTEVNTK